MRRFRRLRRGGLFMPVAPPRMCSKPGCCGRVRGRVCSVCGVRSRSNWRQTKTRQQRGYGRHWQNLRREAILRATQAAIAAGVGLVPVCALCQKPIEDRREIHVDHIRPFAGLDDPLRLDIENLRVCHASCHMRHTGRAGNRSRQHG